MEEFVVSGMIADVVLAFLALEAVALIAWRGAKAAPAVIAALLPGAVLVLALRAALTGAGPLWVAGLLLLSLPAHLLDLRLRPP
jgi:hypothetical protein